MRFAIAAGVLAQTLPVTPSEVNDLVAILAGNLEKVQAKTSIHSLLEGANSKDGAKPKILNGIRRKNGRKHGRKSAVSWMNQRVQDNEALKNAPQEESAVVECDPKKGADVGVLSCDPGKFCMENESSGLGGVCKESAFSGPRSLQGNSYSYDDGVAYSYQRLCNESFPDFDDTYGCDCGDFDGATLTGTIECLLYENECLDPYCNDTCVDTIIAYTAEGADIYGYSACLSVVSPNGTTRACYGSNTNTVEDTYTCSASWNGVDCTCTESAVACATIDCPGDGPSGICSDYFLYEIPALSECQGYYGGGDYGGYSECQLCLVSGTTVDLEAILTLAGYGAISCEAINFAASTGQFNSTICADVQVFAGPGCCVGNSTSMSPSAPDGNSTTMAPSAPAGNTTTKAPVASPTPGGTPTMAPEESGGSSSAPTAAPDDAQGDQTPQPSVDAQGDQTPQPSVDAQGDQTPQPSANPPAGNAPAPADGAPGFVNAKNVVSFMGLSMAMAVYFGI